MITQLLLDHADDYKVRALMAPEIAEDDGGARVAFPEREAQVGKGMEEQNNAAKTGHSSDTDPKRPGKDGIRTIEEPLLSPKAPADNREDSSSPNTTMMFSDEPDFHNAIVVTKESVVEERALELYVPEKMPAVRGKNLRTSLQ